MQTTQPIKYKILSQKELTTGNNKGIFYEISQIDGDYKFFFLKRIDNQWLFLSDLGFGICNVTGRKFYMEILKSVGLV